MTCDCRRAGAAKWRIHLRASDSTPRARARGVALGSVPGASHFARVISRPATTCEVRRTPLRQTVGKCRIMANRLAVEARRRRVSALIARRYQLAEIASIERVDRRTIERDLAAIRAASGASLSRVAESVAADHQLVAIERERQLWLQYEWAKDGRRDQSGQLLQPANAVLALRILQELRVTRQQTVDVLLSLGIVRKAPQQVDPRVAVFDALEKLPPAIVAELSDIRDAVQFEHRLAQCIGPEQTRVLLQSVQ